MQDLIAVGAAFVVYLVVVLGIGAVAYGRTADLADYILGGRRLGRWVTAMSAEASDMSGWLLMGLPGLAYAKGGEALWVAAGLVVGTYLNWKLVAERLRRYTQAAGNALTLPDFFERRFADRSRLLRTVSVVIILLFSTFYTSALLVSGGKLFDAVFGMQYEWAVLLGAAVIVGYTFFGGFFAVAWTDLVQGLLMAAALLLVPVWAIEVQGGWGAAGEAARAVSVDFLSPFRARDGGALGWTAIASAAGWGLGYFGLPHVLARFMAIRDPAELVPARRIAVTWVTLTLIGAVLVGVAGLGYFPERLDDPERVFIALVDALFHPWVAGPLLAAILAAIMSTADSQLLVASSALSEDTYKALIAPHAEPARLMWIGRAAVLIIAAAALWLSMDPERVFELVAYAWAGFGAAFGPAILLALFWRRMTAAGALAGIVCGAVTVIVWKQLTGGIFGLYELIPGFAVSAAAVATVSMATPAPAAPVTAGFDAVAGVGDRPAARTGKTP
ncbi:MAG: sodium/proline symporter PutP [Gammaproteobacteria bacterium]|nr:sodium/proline symporter PutP [Gammaproteobacteria bacterium]